MRRAMYKARDTRDYTVIGFGHIDRCAGVDCGMKRDRTWLRFSIHYDREYHMPSENYNGYYGDVLGGARWVEGIGEW